MVDTTTTTTTTTTTNTIMEDPAHVPTPSLSCALCDLSFNNIQEQRQHAKSEWHVYKLRCRAAEPGTYITPPGSVKDSSSKQDDWTVKPGSRSRTPPTEEESTDEASQSDSSSDKEAIEFVAEECIFCNHTSNDFDENVSHMQQAHSLHIPFRSALTVDFKTLIWYLHLVIFGYRECICCGKRRRTVEAVQQHMTGMGHCRFNITDEMSDFYDMALVNEHKVEGHTQPDDHTLRLPSGKLLTHRSGDETTSKRKQKDKSLADQGELPAPDKRSGNLQALTKRDRKEEALSAQFSRLRTSDQMSLVRLPESQQRALLATQKKELDKAKRAATRRQGRLERGVNKTLIQSRYYKTENPVYQAG